MQTFFFRAVRSLASVLSACLLSCAPAFAQNADALAELAQKLEGTIFTKPHRESADGILTGCGLEFSALKRDFSTKSGAPVKVAGSFYLRPNSRTGIAYVLKLGVFDGFAFDNGFAPYNAFISAPNRNPPTKAIRTLAENPSYGLFIGAWDKDVNAALQSIVDKRQLVVGFNRKPGQQDVAFTLDLSVVDTQMNGTDVVRKSSSEPVDQFNECSRDLLKVAEQLLK